MVVREIGQSDGGLSVGHMTNTTPRGPAVLQLRLIVEAEDYDEAVAFYRDVLGPHRAGGVRG